MIPIYPYSNESNEVIFQSEIDNSQWRRSGTCSRCGNCCDDDENIFKDVDGNGNAPGLQQVVPGKCAYFRWMEDGLAGCVGRDTAYYNNGCNVWPTKKEHIENYSNCTYTFEKIENGS